MVIQNIRSKRHYSENKNKIRKEIVEKRKIFHIKSEDYSNSAAINLIKFFNFNNYYIKDKNISIYWPIGSEINTLPSIAALIDFGAKISFHECSSSKY